MPDGAGRRIARGMSLSPAAHRIAPPAISRTAGPRPLAIARWLVVVALFVLAMLVVGGITRLTESGLSMVRWEPLSGAIPPLNHAQWEAEFAAYRATPEYLKINRGMDLAGFQAIFFWEFLHRLIARLIGVVFAGPLLWFAWRRAIPAGYGWRLSAILALGGLQGGIGWWMVSSGLIDRPDVSHFRLATHLLTALLIFAGTIWTALDLRALARDSTARPARLPGVAVVALAALTIQLMLGAFTAGLDAGYAYASWPLMGDQLFPDGGWRSGWSTLANLSSNPVVVQFVHRWWAWVTAGAALWLGLRGRRAGAAWALPLLAGLLAIQIALGITTLLTGVAIPVAAAHQATAAVLLAALVTVAHRVGSLAR